MTHGITDNSIVYGITDNSVVYISNFSNSWLTSVINSTIIIFQLTSILVWVDILSSLVIYSMASDDMLIIQSTYEAISAEELIST